MSEHDSGRWKGATEIPMPCPECSRFTAVGVDKLMAEGRFACASCDAPVVLGDDVMFQLQGMKTLMSGAG